jgi:hypothetical protein
VHCKFQTKPAILAKYGFGMVFGAVMGLIWFLMILIINGETRFQSEDGYRMYIAYRRSTVRAYLKKFVLTASSFT